MHSLFRTFVVLYFLLFRTFAVWYFRCFSFLFVSIVLYFCYFMLLLFCTFRLVPKFHETYIPPSLSSPVTFTVPRPGTARFSEGPLFRRSVVPKVRCSESSLFRRFVTPKLWFIVPKTRFNIPKKNEFT